MWRLVMFLVFAVLVVIFAGQNAKPVHINFLWWQFPAVSETLVIFLGILLGACLAAAVTWWSRRQRVRGSDVAGVSPGPMSAPEGVNVTGAGPMGTEGTETGGEAPNSPNT